MKTCTKCKQEKEAVNENFRLKKGKLNSQCRECERAYSRVQSKIYYENNKEEVYKKNRARVEKNKDKVKEYMKEYHRQYHQDNKEVLLEKQRKYREENAEMVKAKQQAYYQQNRDRYLENGKIWRANNPDKVAEMRRNWAKDNQDKLREYRQNRRARMKDLVADLTLEQWETTKEYFNNSCAYCGTSEEALCQDHFVPVVDGGGYTMSNIIPACQYCNSSKHDKSFFDWYPSFKHYSGQREEKVFNFLVDMKLLGK